MKIIRSKYLFFTIVCLLAFVFVLPAFAAKTLSDADTNLGKVVGPSGVPTTSLQVQAGNAIRVALTVVGTLFFLLMIYAGLWWMAARGNEEKIKKARGTLIAAMVGLSIIVGAYAVTNFVMSRIILGQSGEGPPTSTTKTPTTPTSPTTVSGLCVSVCTGMSQTACDVASDFCDYNQQYKLCIPDGEQIEDTCEGLSESSCTGFCEYDSANKECKTISGVPPGVNDNCVGKDKNSCKDECQWKG
ncbi:MAG: hypothetical protein ABII02_00800 [Candidatus Magasanikbacteria bacterium]